MDPNSPTFQKWLRASLNEEFGSTVDKWLDKEQDGYKVSQRIIQSKKMKKFMNSTKETFVEKPADLRNVNTGGASRPHTSLSFNECDLFDDEWSLGKGDSPTIREIVDEISHNKPDHVRLAGYEVLLKYDLSALLTNDSWDLFLKTLSDAVSDDSRPIFEATLQMYTKILGFPFPFHEKSVEVFCNLINAYESLYETRKINEIVPTTTSGINLKIFLHEKLCRIMHLLIRHQEEILNSTRTVDKNMEETLEHFFSFLSSTAFLNLSQPKSLNTLNIISVLEPQAEWSKKWNHSVLTRRIFCHTLSKVSSLLQRIVAVVTKYWDRPPTLISFSIVDDVNETFISGDSVETLTYLHCLNFVAQLYAHGSGRALLFEQLSDKCLSVNEFLINLLTSLNASVISEVSSGIYEATHGSLVYILDKPMTLYDARFFAVALTPLMRENDSQMWPHVLDVMLHMLDTVDGRAFLVTEYRTKSASTQKKHIKYPVEYVLLYASNLLKQPLSVMNVEHVKQVFKVIEKIFDINDVYSIVRNVVQDQFFPAIKYFYSNIDKYFVENENKTQKFNKAAKSALLKMTSIPLMLIYIVNEPSILRELIQDSIAPLRTYWNVNEVVSFISNTAFFPRGFDIVKNLSPYVLSTFIIELCKLSEEPLSFHDPWSNADMSCFQHILSTFSLNTKCFMAFITESDEEETHDYPVSLYELYQHCLKPDSPYHYPSLILLKSTIWNLDIYTYLLYLLDFQEEFLKMQENCIIEIQDEEEIKEKYIVDECSLLRHVILCNCYRMEHKRWEFTYKPEDQTLFSKMPTMNEPKGKESNSNSKNELDELLEDDRPGLRDSGWVSAAQKAFKMSEHNITNSSVFNLLIQMQEAIPTVDWTEQYTWDTEAIKTKNYWLPEEIIGCDVVINYAQLNNISFVEKESQYILKQFIKIVYNFIKYEKTDTFDYFDWFLSTIFIVCNGSLEKCKTFITHFIKFPSAVFMWPILSTSIDLNNKDDTTTRLLFAQLLESIIRNEFSTCSNALKHNCGVSWWMICDRLISQCFWGILPWNEILNYLAVCILYPPDYILYYCASLLNHCQHNLLQDVTNGKLWPDHLNLYDYKCHNQIGFMDQLGKRYQGKILPILTQKKLNVAE